jgi:holliday junction DNA helicase RuvA
MIGYIKGRILSKEEGSILLETNGIGYRVFVIPSVFEKETGSDLALYTYLQVREDALNLYGFENPSDKAFFELLLTVSGVGPKMALTILSSGDTNLVRQAISNQDTALFTNIGGVGKKTAERILIDLRDKVAGGESLTASEGSGDLLFALENLGYSKKEIKEVMSKLDHNLSSEEKLKQALKMLGR